MSIYKFYVGFEELDDFQIGLEVPSGITFAQYAEILMASFQIKKGVAHNFFLSNNRWNKINEITLGQESIFDAPVDGVLTKIETVLPDTTTRLIYFHEDFGDHTCIMQLESIEEPVKGKKYPNLASIEGELPNFSSDSALKSDINFAFSDFEEQDLEGLQDDYTES